MKEVIKKELIYDLTETIKILEVAGEKDFRLLRSLSDHAIDDVAAYKDVDLVSMSVLIYSFYKISHCFSKEDFKDIIIELKVALKNLKANNLGRYNRNIKTLFNVINKCDTKIKEHLQDVLIAARVKKSSLLLKKGLSIGQAAGIMGLTNWDLQDYAAKTTALEIDDGHIIPIKKRFQNALKIFGVN